jgi:CRP-like cAMP-binding protein
MDIQQKTAILARTELFGKIDDAILGQLAERVSERSVSKGQSVFVQDAPSERMFVIAEGAVKLYVPSRRGDLVELARHHPPEVFGEVALLDGGPYLASAEALERSLLLVVTRAELLRLFHSHAQVAEALVRSLSTIVLRTTRQVTGLVFLDLQGRVARQLLVLADRRRGTGARRVTQAELAAMVGGARQTVNQALRSLELRGYVRVVGRAFEILDRPQLERLAAG